MNLQIENIRFCEQTIRRIHKLPKIMKLQLFEIFGIFKNQQNRKISWMTGILQNHKIMKLQQSDRIAKITIEWKSGNCKNMRNVRIHENRENVKSADFQPKRENRENGKIRGQGLLAAATAPFGRI